MSTAKAGEGAVWKFIPLLLHLRVELLIRENTGMDTFHGSEPCGLNPLPRSPRTFDFANRVDYSRGGRI
jgi:hypothetical protein